MSGGGSLRLRILLGVVLTVVGCGNEAPQIPASTLGPTPGPGPDRNSDDRVYERNVVFMTAGADSSMIVPWLFRSSASEEGVERVAEGWFARAGLLEPFFAERWSSPPTRSPFRIHPRGAMDLVVGPDDILEAVLYTEGPRQLEVIIAEGISDWSGSRGETFRIHRGFMHLGNLRIEGIVVDMSRVHLRGGPLPGEWIFVTGPELLVLMIEETGGLPKYSGWGMRGDEAYRWPEVEVEWTSLRSFDEARRDVPVAWDMRSGDGDIRLSLVSNGMELRALDGEGPLLPVEGLAQVSGPLVFGGDSMQVRGLVRHVQQ